MRYKIMIIGREISGFPVIIVNVTNAATLATTNSHLPWFPFNPNVLNFKDSILYLNTSNTADRILSRITVYISPTSIYFNKNGKPIQNKALAGVGTPINESDWSVLMLNIAKRIALISVMMSGM